VAGVLLAVGMLGALELIARTAVTTAAVQDRSRALIFARSKMEEILKEPVLQVGTDRGEGVDESTDYDWQATIEESQHPGLVMVVVVAKNRVTEQEVAVTALRRPDIQTLPEDTTGTGTEPGTTTGAATPGGGT